MLIYSIAYAEERTWIRVEGGSWQPSDQIISKVKMNLEPYMRSQGRSFGRSLKKWSVYRFQYQGQQENGQKFLYINAFCGLDYTHGLNLSRDFVLVHDGGSCFFRLKYNPDTDKFYDAFINGEA
jgi:hypothetical protein